MFERNARILFQGDSITDYGRDRNVDAASPANQGLGSSHAMLIAAHLLAEYPERNLQFYNRGFCGDTILRLAARWKTDTLDLHPDYLSILIGANDTWGRFRGDGGVDLPLYESVYRELLDRKGPESPVPEARTAAYYAQRPCAAFVGTAARILEDYIAAHPPKPLK